MLFINMYVYPVRIIDNVCLFRVSKTIISLICTYVSEFGNIWRNNFDFSLYTNDKHAQTVSHIRWIQNVYIRSIKWISKNHRIKTNPLRKFEVGKLIKLGKREASGMKVLNVPFIRIFDWAFSPFVLSLGF